MKITQVYIFLLMSGFFVYTLHAQSEGLARQRNAALRCVGGMALYAPSRKNHELHKAISCGDAEMVEGLLLIGADAQNGPLHAAIEQYQYEDSEGSSDRVRIVELLLDAGAQVHMKGSKGQTPLIAAIEKGSGSLVTLLVKKGAPLDISGTSYDDVSPLHAAVRKGDRAMVGLLLQLGASINTMDSSEKAPLFFAIENNDAAMVELLLQLGAHADIEENLSGYTPLHKAAYSGSEKIVELLIKAKADINACDRLKRTPLGEAFIYNTFRKDIGNDGVIRLLVEAGADYTGYEELLIERGIIEAPTPHTNGQAAPSCCFL